MNLTLNGCCSPAVFISILVAALATPLRAAILPDADQRAGPPKTLNTLRTFPEIRSKAEWQARASEIREHILWCCGLWPMPEKTPLKARVFARIERDGYSVEKVHLQTYPGFYLCGNLYRPLGQGQGPFPGILNPHGHWRQGRLTDVQDGSIPARCLSFARQGMVAFAYDMVGYNDTAQVNHKFASDRTNLLWNISLMGLQTWNSIRALDFLESLPDVDKKRLGCTGASGGGTQTFMLGAIDDRLAAQAPCVMVSHSMQGGCLCENAPGLRVDYSNMEIATVPAPRPQILVAATGDWTRATLTVEGPAIESVYRLLGAEDHLRFVRYDFGHNYNQTTREAVYEWFGRWLLKERAPVSFKEQEYAKPSDADLLVWPDRKLPADALNEEALIQSMVRSAQAAWESLKPKDQPSFRTYRQVMLPAWRHCLQVELPERGLLVKSGEVRKLPEGKLTRLCFGRAGKGDRVPALLITPPDAKRELLAVLIHAEGQAACYDEGAGLKGLAKELLGRGCRVIALDAFPTGPSANTEPKASRQHFSNFFSTYNRTDLQERIQDLVSVCAIGRKEYGARRIVLCGSGRAGLWALLAAPAADAVLADCDALDLRSDAVLLEQDLFAPGLRRMGAFAGVASLAAPNPLLLHNVGEHFPTGRLADTYEALKATHHFREEMARLPDPAAADWVAGVK